MWLGMLYLKLYDTSCDGWEFPSRLTGVYILKETNPDTFLSDALIIS